MSPLARRSHKDGCTTASLQYQWCVEQQNPTLQNLINVLDLTFVQVCSPLLWNLLRIPCTKIIIIIIITLITCKLPLRVSQGTVATFYRCGGQNYNRLFPVFSGFTVPKIITIGSFSTELLKTVIAFLKHGVYIRLCPRCCTWQITLNWQRSLALCETWRHPQNRKNIPYRTAAREWPRYAHKQQAPKIWRGLNGWFLRYARRDM